jgi:putative ABC transport system permease protein
MDRFRHDLRLSLRSLRRAPTFSMAAVTILAVGIGMSAAMFTVFRAVLVTRLPVIDQDRIAVLWTYRDPSIEQAGGTKELAAIRRESRTMRDIAGVAHWPASPVPMLSGERAILLGRSLVTGNFFDVLGVKPVIGRLLKPSDDAVGNFQTSGANSSQALVLSYAAWQGKFGGDPSVIGRHLIEPYSRWEYTIVGVAPPGVDYPAGAEFWAPLWGGWSGEVSTIAVARLAPGTSLAAARAEYFSIANRLNPEVHWTGAHAATFTETVLGDITPIMRVLIAAVGVLLLLACLNVGNLVLLRASVRGREIAVRRALGAAYGDIVRQMLVEATLLAMSGGILGLALAEALLRVLVRLAPAQLPRLEEVRLTGAPVLAAVAIAAITVLLFGVAPALIAARANLASVLRSDSRSGSETGRRRTVRQLLVATQVALAMLMLTSAGLLAHSLARLQGQELGYTPEHLAILCFSFNGQRYDSLPKLLDLGDRVLPRLDSLPGIVAATPILIPPLLGANVWQARVDREGQTEAEAALNPMLPIEAAGPDYFRVFQTPILRGRAFTDADREPAPPVAIVSESVARRYWPGESPIGKRLRLPPAWTTVRGSPWRTVIGLVPDTHFRSLRETTPMVYLPWHQGEWQSYFAIRTRTELGALLPSLRRVLHEADPQADLWYAHTMDDLLAEPLAQPRFGTLLMSSFGLSALLLAAVGLFGVISSIVVQQTRELGIRMALGATPGIVQRAVMRRAADLTIGGAAAGLAGAVVASRLFRGLLFEVTPVDPFALLGAAGVLIVVGALAAYAPARRATRIDPATALRAD